MSIYILYFFCIYRCLLHAGADPRLAPAALAAACWEGNTCIVRDLLRAGAPPDSEDIAGALPLHIAATLGHQSIVEALLASGAMVDSEDGFGHTALHKAAFGGHLGAVEALLRGKAGEGEPSARDTPLHAACDRGHLPVVSLLLHTNNRSVHSPDADGETPLHRACHGGHIHIVRHLADAGADLEAVTSERRTALHLASDCRCTLSIGALLERMDQDRIDPRHTDEFACYCTHTSHDATEVVHYLLDRDVDVNATDNSRQTALHLASRLNNVTIVQLLMAAGAKVNAVNKYLETPLHLACEHARLGVVTCLVENGADLGQVTFYTATPLDLAFHKYNTSDEMLRTIRYLTSQGCPLLDLSRNALHISNWTKYALVLWAGGFMATRHHVWVTSLLFAITEGYDSFYRLLLAAQPHFYKGKHYSQIVQKVSVRLPSDDVISDDFRQDVLWEMSAPSTLYQLTIGAIRDHITLVSNGNSIIPRLELLTGIVSRSISDDLLLMAQMRTILPTIFDC